MMGDDALRCSSDSFKSVEQFNAAFSVKLSLATKIQIKYGAIKCIKKEVNSHSIFIVYRTWIGIPLDCVFKFYDEDDVATFFHYFEKVQYFQKQELQLTPFEAITKLLIVLFVVIIITAFFCYIAIDMAHGGSNDISGLEGMMISWYLKQFGFMGALVPGIFVTGFLIYKSIKRFKHPPMQVKYLPPLS